MPASRTRGARSRVCEAVSFVGWHVLMLVWLLSWLFGVWWVWPVVAQLELNGDLIGGVFWLFTGGLAWVIAFIMGYRRYWLR